MYLLPQNFTGDFLVGRTVDSISFFQFHFDVFFSEKCWLHIESRYRICRKNDFSILEEPQEFPLIKTLLVQLIGKRISAIKCVNRSDLIITFDDLEITVYGNIGPYEAYRISDGEQEFLV